MKNGNNKFVYGVILSLLIAGYTDTAVQTDSAIKSEAAVNVPLAKSASVAKKRRTGVSVENKSLLPINFYFHYVKDTQSAIVASHQTVNAESEDSAAYFMSFSGVRIVDAAVGQQWGIDPATRAPLTLTADMIIEGYVYGINNHVYESADLSSYENYYLYIVPEWHHRKNMWWPSFKLGRSPAAGKQGMVFLVPTGRCRSERIQLVFQD